MASLNDKSLFEDIFRLENDTPAEAMSADGEISYANIQAQQLANRTRWLRTQLVSISDFREYTFFKTAEDPDGTIAGRANTPDGKLFRVSQGDGNELAFKYYLHKDGAAIPDATLIGIGSIKNSIRIFTNLAVAQADAVAGNIPDGSTAYLLSSDDDTLAIEIINNAGTLQPTGRVMPSNEIIELLKGLIDANGDNPFSIVFKNGLSPFGYKDGRLYADEFQKLYSSDAGLEFGGSIIDNNPPDGWRFVIYYRNGLVMCGQRNDGTMIGFGEGGSGGGSIEPGDTAADYDSIRNYTGTATVRDVVGQRTGGRFVVNPDDTTSEEIPGGILVDVLGRRWYRQAEFVSYDMFMAPRVPGATLLSVQVALAMGNRSSAIAYLSGVEAADAAIQNAHRYANLLNVPVRQNDGAFLMLVDHEAEVRTKTSLGGSIIFTSVDSGVNEIRWGPLRLLDPAAPEPKRMFNIKGKERIELTTAELATFNASYSQYLKKGSNYLPYPKLYPYYGGMFYALSNEVEIYRNGNRDNPRDRVLYRDFSRIGRNGALTERIVKDIPTGSIGYAAIMYRIFSYNQLK